jgi:hypothetical protein
MRFGVEDERDEQNLHLFTALLHITQVRRSRALK